MKIVKILGGLGNQMFQYAFYLFLKKNGIEAKLDISGFKKYNLHYGFELNRIFNLVSQDEIATDEEVVKYKDQFPAFKIRKIFDHIFFKKNNFLIKKTHWIEPNFSHYYPIATINKYNYLDGYWQNENYLKNIDHQLRNLFCWKYIDNINLRTIKAIESQSSVFIHIRRFDSPKSIKEWPYYIKLKILWRVASKNYYLKAISIINREIKDPHFYVFTDNLDWVNKNLKLNENYTVIDWNRKEKSNFDLLLMSKCKHGIISMSSFSWWAAWLIVNPEKIIIAPKKWALRFTQNVKIIPQRWIKI